MKQLNRSVGLTFRDQRHIAFSEAAATYLSDVLPSDNGVTVAAAATMSFEFRGQFANGNMYGLGVLTHAQTYGNAPNGCGDGGYACQFLANGRIELTDDDAADIVLGCFGLSVTDVLRHFGEPLLYERKTITLQQIVETLASQLLTETAAAIAG